MTNVGRGQKKTKWTNSFSHSFSFIHACVFISMQCNQLLCRSFYTHLLQQERYNPFLLHLFFCSLHSLFIFLQFSLSLSLPYCCLFLSQFIFKIPRHFCPFCFFFVFINLVLLFRDKFIVDVIKSRAQKPKRMGTIHSHFIAERKAKL